MKITSLQKEFLDYNHKKFIEENQSKLYELLFDINEDDLNNKSPTNSNINLINGTNYQK